MADSSFSADSGSDTIQDSEMNNSQSMMMSDDHNEDKIYHDTYNDDDHDHHHDHDDDNNGNDDDDDYDYMAVQRQRQQRALRTVPKLLSSSALLLSSSSASSKARGNRRRHQSSQNVPTDTTRTEQLQQQQQRQEDHWNDPWSFPQFVDDSAVWGSSTMAINTDTNANTNTTTNITSVEPVASAVMTMNVHNQALDTSLDSAFLPFVPIAKKTQPTSHQQHHHHQHHKYHSVSKQQMMKPDRSKSRSSSSPSSLLANQSPPEAIEHGIHKTKKKGSSYSHPRHQDTELLPDPFDVAFGGGQEGGRARAAPTLLDVTTTTTGPSPNNVTKSYSMIPTPPSSNPMTAKPTIITTSKKTSNKGVTTRARSKSRNAPRTTKKERVLDTIIPRKVQVVVQERLSILFEDDNSKSNVNNKLNTNENTHNKDGPICRVVGSIFVRPSPSSSTTKNATSKQQQQQQSDTSSTDSFCLTVRDKKAHIEHWDDQRDPQRCRNITAGVPHTAVDPGDQVFLISSSTQNNNTNMDPQHDEKRGRREGGAEAEPSSSPILAYTCIPRLRPMPMLVKTKVHRKNDRCRVGIRIRANPQNGYLLTDVIVLVIVPLDMDAESVTMSRKGGIWDELKRTLVWMIPELSPGETLDIQAQFKCLMVEGGQPINHNDDMGGTGDDSCLFPVLAKCNGNTSFSKIDLHADYTEEGSNPVELEVARYTTVLYRKA